MVVQNAAVVVHGGDVVDAVVHDVGVVVARAHGVGEAHGDGAAVRGVDA